jgi:hypothetical protein
MSDAWNRPPESPATEMAKEECDLRVRADALRQEAAVLGWQADKLQQRMQRIGQRSWYVGKIPR